MNIVLKLAVFVCRKSGYQVVKIIDGSGHYHIVGADKERKA